MSLRFWVIMQDGLRRYVLSKHRSYANAEQRCNQHRRHRDIRQVAFYVWEQEP